jgi:tetratricopeptide (TPR) repeat protein
MSLTRLLHLVLPKAEVEKRESQIIEDLKAERPDAAWSGLESLLRAQGTREQAAQAVVRIVGFGQFPVEKALAALEQVYSAHPRSESLLGRLGEALDRARDTDFLNAPPPDHPLFSNVANTLAQLVEKPQARVAEIQLLRGLFTAARMMSRQRDELVETSGRRLVALDPDNASHHYNLGLFFKTRGHFREGMTANQAAARLVDAPPESYEWNLGICATGAGEGALALEVWKRLGQRIEMGRFGLPDGSYPQCKVRLAQRPLAERTAESDDPGLEETIWIERLSPCHGIIRSVLYQDLGVDYGDVILFDGAPITHHTYGEQQIPVFPHLATLVRHEYRLFDFAGTQEETGQIADASDELERDAIVYSHSENFVVLCAACWRDTELDHSHEENEEKRVVTGRIAAPPDLSPRDLLQQLDAAMSQRTACRLYVPDLCEAAGLSDRAAFERRRFGMIAGERA